MFGVQFAKRCFLDDIFVSYHQKDNKRESGGTRVGMRFLWHQVGCQKSTVIVARRNSYTLKVESNVVSRCLLSLFRSRS